ncbi:MAG: chromosomal replication initiator protein DnaA, partial [Actinobacteria bacterium]|nr:chromosomal replication initiator protein DnaA [Actinomycetota bacterium]
VLARQVGMYLLRLDGGQTLLEIGRALGDRDHTTVLHGVNKIERRLQLDDRLRSDLEGVRARLAEPS